jgi:endonuclease-8
VPEGDDIWRLAGRLHGALAGRTLVRTDFRVPSLANADLAGRRIDAVESRGKHILMRTDARLTVHSHLKMDGVWLVLRTGTRARTPSHEIRAVLVTEPWTAVGSLLGILDVWPTAQQRERLGHLGPDVLGSDWDPAAALRRLTADPARLVGEVLIDQRVMAGPGNVYRSEVCFLRGIDPRTPGGIGAGSGRHRGPDEAADGAESASRRPDHDGRPSQPLVGVWARYLPPLRNADRPDLVGPVGRGARRLPLPQLPAGDRDTSRRDGPPR